MKRKIDRSTTSPALLKKKPNNNSDPCSENNNETNVSVTDPSLEPASPTLTPLPVESPSPIVSPPPRVPTPKIEPTLTLLKSPPRVSTPPIVPTPTPLRSPTRISTPPRVPTPTLLKSPLRVSTPPIVPTPTLLKSPLRVSTPPIVPSPTLLISPTIEPTLTLLKSPTISAASSSHVFFPNPFLPDLSAFERPIRSNLIPDCFSSLLTIEKLHSTNFKKPKEAIFDIHSLTSLKVLLEEKKKNKERPDLRFLLDLNKDVWFARETHTGIPAPAHYQMTGEPQSTAYCITAGNLFLTSDYKTLVKINHKSGDFRPSFDSLKWFIALLILNEKRLPFALPEILLVEELSSSGGVNRTLEWDATKLREWVLHVFANELVVNQLQQQSQGVKKVTYTKEPPLLDDAIDPLPAFKL